MSLILYLDTKVRNCGGKIKRHIKREVTKNKKDMLERTYLLRRSQADSNRRARFCRPLTKPLIHATIFVLQRYYYFANVPNIYCLISK